MQGKMKELYHETPCCDDGEREKDFKLECVIVCDQYSDFLRCTLPHNKTLFDRVVVVTSPEDKATRKICEFYHVEAVVTDALESRWGRFCKGRGINAGLERLKKDAWVLHLDADIWLPPQTRILLERAYLDRRMIYGIDRFNVRGFKQWHDFLSRPQLQHECDAYIHLNNGLPLGTRVMQATTHGYIPIGFFQLWHPKVSGIDSYPEKHNDAGRTDMQHAARWPRCQRALIPEILGYHLESDDAGFGTNWAGRKSAEFTL